MRWDNDERGAGVGNARTLLPDAQRLLEAMDEATWVAEEPEAHLLPQLRRACEDARTPIELVGTKTTDDGNFVVDVAPPAR